MSPKERIHCDHNPETYCQFCLTALKASEERMREALEGAEELLLKFNDRGTDDRVSFIIGKILFENMDKLTAIKEALRPSSKEIE